MTRGSVAVYALMARGLSSTESEHRGLLAASESEQDGTRVLALARARDTL